MSRTQEKIDDLTRNDNAAVHAGVDVSKEALDVFISPHALRLRVDNNKTGIKALIRQCKRHDVRLVAMEATGKYHCLLHELLSEAGIAAAVVNPFRMRQFADSLGRLAKTDTIDAEVIARFAACMKPETTPPPTAPSKALKGLHAARRQVLDEIGDLKRKLHATDHALAAKQMRARLKMAERHKEALDQEIRALIAADAAMKRKFDILTSIPGIGAATAGILITDLSELGQVNARQIAALTGVAPMNWDSGAKNGKRMIRGGRKTARNALYMCAVCCIRRSSQMGGFYRQLIKRGKSPKVALTAVIRKLAILANTLIAQDRCWQPHCPSPQIRP